MRVSIALRFLLSSSSRRCHFALKSSLLDLPEIESAHRMAHLPRWNPKVCSDYNLAAFQQWLPMQDPDEAAKYLDLFIVEHEDPPVPAFIRGLLDSDVYHIQPRIRVHGNEILIPRRPCSQPQCDLCGLRGGYKFQWMGP